VTNTEGTSPADPGASPPPCPAPDEEFQGLLAASSLGTAGGERFRAGRLGWAWEMVREYARLAGPERPEDLDQVTVLLLRARRDLTRLAGLLSPPGPPGTAAPGQLTDAEQRAHDGLGFTLTLFRDFIVGDGPARDADMTEITRLILALQALISGHALARSEPGSSRLLGEATTPGGQRRTAAARKKIAAYLAEPAPPGIIADLRDLGVIGYANELPGVTAEMMRDLVTTARANGRTWAQIASRIDMTAEETEFLFGPPHSG
jgi:hypothetical protein